MNRPTTVFESFALSQTTPSLVYDLPKLRRTARNLRHLAAYANGIACYSVKADRTPRVLEAFALAGMGADVASAEEFAAASKAGCMPIVATSPGLSAQTLAALHSAGACIYFDSAEQVRVASRQGIDLSRHGVRMAMPGDYRHFGIDGPSELARLGAELDFRPEKIHVHCGEIVSIAALRERLTRIGGLAVELGATTIDLGGGYGVLSNDPKRLEHAFDLLAAFASEYGLRLIFEFGKVAVARSAALVATVIARKMRGETQILVIDASLFNLGTWEARTLRCSTGRGDADTPTVVMGPTCYEHDRLNEAPFAAHCLDVGDRLLIAPCGAYTTSIGGHLHGLPHPALVFFEEETIGKRADIRFSAGVA